MYARALGFVKMLHVCLMYFCVAVVGYAVDNRLKKNQNATRPSGHPPVRGKKCCCTIYFLIHIFHLCLSRLLVGTGGTGHFQYFESRPFVRGHQSSPSGQVALQTVVCLFYFCIQHHRIIAAPRTAHRRLNASNVDGVWYVCVSYVVRARSAVSFFFSLISTVYLQPQPRKRVCLSLSAQLLGRSKSCLLCVGQRKCMGHPYLYARFRLLCVILCIKQTKSYARSNLCF